MAVSPKPKENITIETSKCLIIYHELHYNDDKRFLRVGILFSVCFVKDSMLISIYFIYYVRFPYLVVLFMMNFGNYLNDLHVF